MTTTVKLPAILLFASCLAVYADTEEHLSKRFTVQPGGSIVVDVDIGTIDVKTNDTSEVVVEVLRKVSRPTKAEEEEFLAARPVTIMPVANTVRIESRAETKDGTPSRGRQRTECRYTITVPGKFNAQIKTGVGAVSVSDLVGELKAQTGGGGLTFTQLQGPLDGNTGGGAIRVADCRGEQQVKTAGGGIEISGGTGSFVGSTGGGLVSVKDFKGTVQAKSAGGGMKLENVTGKVDGKTGGGAIAARFDSPLADDVSLVTAGGGVTLEVTEKSAFDLDAVTSGGNVSSDLMVESGEKNKKTVRNRLKGPVNGGGKAVVLRTGGGGIQVRKL